MIPFRFGNPGPNAMNNFQYAVEVTIPRHTIYKTPSNVCGFFIIIIFWLRKVWIYLKR